MPEVTAKAKSAIYHLKTALSGLEKAQVHLIQARTSLPKGDEDSRAEVGGAEQALNLFAKAIDEAVTAITMNNLAKPKEAEDDAS